MIVRKFDVFLFLFIKVKRRKRCHKRLVFLGGYNNQHYPCNKSIWQSVRHLTNKEGFEMSFSQFNIDIFRAINDLGKQYSFLNPAIVFLAEYMVYILALIILTYWFIGSRKVG